MAYFDSTDHTILYLEIPLKEVAMLHRNFLQDPLRPYQ